MSGEALEKWVEDDMRDVPCAMPVDEASEYMCREAWHAAVRHTLAFVAEDLRTQRDNPLPPPRRPSIRKANWLGNLASYIETMKP